MQSRLGRPPKYPWDKWIDGEEHTIEKGVDFHVTTVGFQTTLHVTARSKGMKVMTAIDGDKITFQFYTPTDEAR